MGESRKDSDVFASLVADEILGHHQPTVQTVLDVPLGLLRG